MIAIGCDHGGYELKKEIEAYLDSRGLEYRDYGCDSTDSVDYPIYARKVAHAIVKGECERGILICGTGIGISIAANKSTWNPCCIMYRLFLCTGNQRTQRCQCTGTWWKSCRTGTCH